MQKITKSVTTMASIALTAVILLTACGGEQLAEQIGEQAINGEVQIDDDSISITDEEGNELSAGGGTELPASWPANVPAFPDGDLVVATSMSEGSATALWETTQPVDAAAATYEALLVSSGFTLEQDAVIDGTIVRSYRGDTHIANMTVAKANGSTNISVSVVTDSR